MHRRILAVGLVFLALVAASVAQAQGPMPPAGKSGLNKVAPQVLAAAKGGPAEFLVMLSQQADLSGASALAAPDARRQYVYDRVREVAEKSQDGVIRDVAASGAAYQRFALTNALLVRGDAALVAKLAARPDVQRIEANPQVQAVRSAPEETSADVSGPGTPWGITQIKANQVWAQGVRGAGIVVGVADTGVDWTHPAIQPKYRGWTGASGGTGAAGLPGGIGGTGGVGGVGQTGGRGVQGGKGGTGPGVGGKGGNGTAGQASTSVGAMTLRTAFKSSPRQ